MKSDAPLAFPAKIIHPGDRLVLILRSGIWDEKNVSDITKTLDDLDIVYAILYLDATDEAHVIRQ